MVLDSTGSTNEKINSYIKNTSIFEDTKLGPIHEETNDFNLDLKVYDDTDKPKYHTKLTYLPNENFNYNESISPNSIPNTFKNKSHPNAKTKELPSQTAQISSFTKDDVKTSTLKDFTPDWMPSELNEKWVDQLLPKNFDIVNISNTNTNTNTNSIIHNSNPIRTPAWKKVKQTYDDKSLKPLRNFFEAEKSMSSTFSTFYNSKSHHDSQEISKQLTQQQVNEIKELLDHDKDKPDDYLIELPNASPLKLFGNNYNTFTKGKLNEIISNLKAPGFTLKSASDQPEDKIEDSKETSTAHIQSTKSEGNASYPKLKTKKYDNIEEKFREKANNIFDNIQKRGVFLRQTSTLSNLNNNRGFSETVNPELNENKGFNNSLVTNTLTATSTPKIDKINELNDIKEYSSFSSGFNNTTNIEKNVAEDSGFTFTESSNRSLEDSISRSKTNEVQPKNEIHNVPRESYTRLSSESISSLNSDSSLRYYDEPTQHQFQQSVQYRPKPIVNDKDNYNDKDNDYKLQLEAKIKHLETTVDNFKIYQKNMEALINENNNLRTELSKSNLNNDLVFEINLPQRPEEEFKMKRISQLKLGLPQVITNNNQKLNRSQSNMNRGMLKPINLPNQYGNMVLDEVNHRWIAEDKENYSLDMIDDLPEEKEVTKNVSFQLPNQVNSSPFDATRISQMDEFSFSQHQKKLVAIITDKLADVDWNKVNDLDLTDKGLENVKDFQEFLPNVIKLNLASNRIKYLNGLPESLLDLNLSNNRIENMTSFQEFINLQKLNLSQNILGNCDGLQYNIHLSKLNMSNNNLSNISGLSNLVNLIELDVSGNNLSNIDFADFHFESLQVLNLSENKLKIVKNIDQVPDLRILNLNENQLTEFKDHGKHLHLKKLLLKFNHLESIDLDQFPYLRTLRIDGNNFVEVNGNLKFIEEASCKCLSKIMLQKMFTFETLKTLDLSGNIEFTSLEKPRFPNVNKLTLSAINLTDYNDFNDIFPNLMELNLNFNKLTTLSFLKELKYLKKLYVVSNNLVKIEGIVTSLTKSRSHLKVLDLRLNPINLDFYSYVFNPQELDIDMGNFIQLETLDDIENFSIHYESLNNKNDWEIRDESFRRTLKSKKFTKRTDYQTLLINYFPNLKKLDGCIISSDKRQEFTRYFK